MSVQFALIEPRAECRQYSDSALRKNAIPNKGLSVAVDAVLGEPVSAQFP